MSIARIFKDSFYYGVIPKIGTVINIVLMPIITPYLTPFDYGVWGVITSYSGLMLSIAPLGLHIHLPNSFYEYNKWQLVWGRILFYFYVSSLTLSLLNIVLLLFVLTELPFGLRFVAAVLGTFPVLLFCNSSLAAAFYPIMGKPKPLVFRNLTGALCSIAVSFVTIYVFRLGFWGFIIGSATSSLVTFLLFIRPLNIQENIRPIVDTKKRHFLKFMKVSVFVIPHSIGFTLLTSSSRILMTCFGIPLDDIGIYTNGYSIGDYVTVVSTSVAVALAPTLQNLWRSRQYENYRRFFYVSVIITISAVFLVSIWMPELYSMLIRNEKFKPSILIASTVCFANIVYPFYSFQSTIAFIEKRTAEVLWLIFLPGIINVFLCCVLLPLYGYRAAAYTTLIAFWSQLTVPLISKYHRERARQWLGSPIKLFVLLTLFSILFMVSMFFVDLPWVAKVIVSFIVVSCGFLVLIRISKNLKLIYGK